MLWSQATISYGQKPNEAFLLHYGFVDTSYQSDFYNADLLEYVQQQHNIPAARVAALANSQKLYKSVESVRPYCCAFHGEACVPPLPSLYQIKQASAFFCLLCIVML